ncbi:MAG: hypothetical protein ACOY4H_06435 [Thermodesulfobacteriota bacterium]
MAGNCRPGAFFFSGGFFLLAGNKLVYHDLASTYRMWRVGQMDGLPARFLPAGCIANAGRLADIMGNGMITEIFLAKRIEKERNAQ